MEKSFLVKEILSAALLIMSGRLGNAKINATKPELAKIVLTLLQPVVGVWILIAVFQKDLREIVKILEPKEVPLLLASLKEPVNSQVFALIVQIILTTIALGVPQKESVTILRLVKMQLPVRKGKQQ
eukprot:CAMPEP_0174260280 /NCGR_PEP_ID=MMETSP0439-20130205/9485_1 /TAXON_ID=0 /ORGANISM="Stereomyxa ramosa, Strain Chinc5" /LENGTH=126 /DNA_ID=CAMNT_0015344493 /DNA_START=224 /DNA_END=604 /DNA_ORIENTATION=+